MASVDPGEVNLKMASVDPGEVNLKMASVDPGEVNLKLMMRKDPVEKLREIQREKTCVPFVQF